MLSSFRLYALGALALLIVGMAGIIMYYRGNAIDAEARAARVTAERDTAIAVSAAKDKEIDRLTRQAEINNNIMVDLHTAMQELNAKAAETNQALTELETTNADVRLFLDTALPAELKRLLNVK